MIGALFWMIVTSLIVTAFGGPGWAAFGFSFLTYLVIVGRR